MSLLTKNRCRRKCEVCGKPISGQQWSARRPEHKKLLCRKHLHIARRGGVWTPQEEAILKLLLSNHTIWGIYSKIRVLEAEKKAEGEQLVVKC